MNYLPVHTMKYEHDPRLPWRNPESVPLSQIPEGWRLMLPGEKGWSKNTCRIWLLGNFSNGDHYYGTTDNVTAIIPSTVPLPEEFRGKPNEPIAGMPGWYRTPEAKPAVTELRDRLAGQILAGIIASESQGTGQLLTKPSAESRADWKFRNAVEAYEWADAMLKAREAKP